MHQDNRGMWHKKDIRKGRDNNVFIYGAYAKALGLDVSKYPEYFKRCVKSLDKNNIKIFRHPGLPSPPFSFDECLGAIYLGLIPYDILKGNEWVYIGEGEKFDERAIFKLAKALAEFLLPEIVVKGWSIKVRKKDLGDRNRWWRENLENVAYFATRLTPDKIYIIKRFFKKKFHKEEEKLFVFHRDCILKTKPKTNQDFSTRNILWLMLIMNNDHKRAKKMKPWKSFESYFGKDHDFTKAIKKKYGVK
jgi:hypothetical protein